MFDCLSWYTFWYHTKSRNYILHFFGARSQEKKFLLHRRLILGKKGVIFMSKHSQKS
jgi:hypothetical protein